MSKAQFWLLNFVGGTSAVRLLSNVVFVRLSDRVIRVLEAMQTRIARARQIQKTAQNLVGRIAPTATTEAALKDLLVRHELRVGPDHEPADRPAP